MRFAGLSEIRAYWEALSASGGGVPPRAALDPRGIERALPQAFLLMRAGDGTMGVRVLGQAVAAITGGAPPETGAETLVCTRDRVAFARLLETVLGDPARAELDLEYRPCGGAPVAARMVLLPMTDDRGQAAYVLGGLAMAHVPALPGPWPLELLGSRVQRVGLSGTNASPPPGADFTAAPTAQRAPGLAEAAAAYGALPKRGHLRIVK